MTKTTQVNSTVVSLIELFYKFFNRWDLISTAILAECNKSWKNTKSMDTKLNTNNFTRYAKLLWENQREENNSDGDIHYKKYIKKFV